MNLIPIQYYMAPTVAASIPPLSGSSTSRFKTYRNTADYKSKAQYSIL
jgi:hypothetical protein